MADKNTNGYAETHTKIKKIRYMAVVLLVIFVILAVFFFREDLTVENFRYLMKYVNVKPVTFGSDENTQINFESDSATVTASFKEDLIVLTKSSLKIYDLTSKEILDVSHSLTTPALALGERYFAVYDLGARYIGIYNSFSKLTEIQMAYPVYDVALDENGNFAVATSDKGYTSSLKVYNSNFKNIFNWNSVDKHSVCTDIYSEEKLLMAVGTVKSTPSGDMLSGLVILSSDSTDIVASLDFNSEFIMRVAFNSEGNIVCLTDSALRIISISGEILNEYSFSPDSLVKFEAGEDFTALLLKENILTSDYSMIIFDTKGNTYMEISVKSEITDICISSDFVFLLGVEDITVVDLHDKETQKYSSDRSYHSVELIDTSNVYLVYNGLALAYGVK